MIEIEAPISVTATLQECVLRGDALMQEYFAVPTTCCGAVLMTCDRDDTFNLAMVDGVPPWAADAVLAAIVAHYEQRGATPRIRLSPCSDPGWPSRLVAAGFIETGERRRFWIVPDSVDVAAPLEIDVTRVTSPADADRFSAIQTFAFAVPDELHEWDRQLARRRLAEGSVHVFLGRLHGSAVGAGAVMPLGNGAAGLWGLATLPVARHQGVATAVLGGLIAHARAIGGEPVFFTTAWDNPMAIAYARLGCVPLFRTRTFARTR